MKKTILIITISIISCTNNDVIVNTAIDDNVVDLKGKLKTLEFVINTHYQKNDELVPYKDITKEDYIYYANGLLKEVRAIQYSIDSNTTNPVINSDTITHLKEYKYENNRIKEIQTYRKGNSITIESFNYTGDLITERIEAYNSSYYTYKYTYNSAKELIKEEMYKNQYPSPITIIEFINTNGVITHETQTKGDNAYSIEYIYDEYHNPLKDILPSAFLKILKEGKNNRLNKYNNISNITYNSDNYPLQKIDSDDYNTILETYYQYYK